MAVFVGSLDQKVAGNSKFSWYSWLLGPFLTLYQVIKLYFLPLGQNCAIWGPRSAAIVQNTFTHMALCTSAVSIGHDLKPHRGKGRSIETTNRKESLWISLHSYLCLYAEWAKLAKTPAQWVWHRYLGTAHERVKRVRYKNLYHGLYKSCDTCIITIESHDQIITAKRECWVSTSLCATRDTIQSNCKV